MNTASLAVVNTMEGLKYSRYRPPWTQFVPRWIPRNQSKYASDSDAHRDNRWSYVAPPAGFEPALPPPEGGALSPELRGLAVAEHTVLTAHAQRGGGSGWAPRWAISWAKYSLSAPCETTIFSARLRTCAVSPCSAVYRAIGAPPW
jgi:hypothetical protein